MELKREKMESIKYGWDVRHARLTRSLVVQYELRSKNTSER